jgi:glutathione S-transferase
MGRMTDNEIARIAGRTVEALSIQLGDKPWLMGDEPTGADATVWSFVSGGLCPLFEARTRTLMEAHPNLPAYRDRGLARWFPDLPAI